MTHCTRRHSFGHGFTTFQSYRDASPGVLFGVIDFRHFGRDRAYCKDHFNSISVARRFYRLGNLCYICCLVFSYF